MLVKGLQMRTFEFANARGRLGTLILEPGKPPVYYWSGRGDCPEEVRKALTEGLRDPENGDRVGGDKPDVFFEVLEYEFAKGQHLVGRRGRNITELPRDARALKYTPGVSALFD